MIPGMGVHIGSGIIGGLLLLASVLLFLAGYIQWLRRWIEVIFISSGDNLFASGKSYSGTVTFLRWSAFFFGALLLLPTFVLIDIVAAAVGFLLWRYFVRRAHVAIAGKPA